MKKTLKISLKILFFILLWLFFVLSYAIVCICNWALKTFDVNIDSIIFTILNPIKGAGTDVVSDALHYCLPRVISFAVITIIFLVIIFRKRKNNIILNINIIKKNFDINFNGILKIVSLLLSVICLIGSVLYVDKYYKLFDYIKLKQQSSLIYETYYVNPLDVNISANNEKKNLIYIYVESLETTYTSKENGGYQEECYIPNLMSLARENISFSDTDQIGGGFYNVTNSFYTTGALLASTSGIPWAFPIEGNSMNTREYFASGLTNLGDVLSSFGYNQTFMCGSDADFGGRETLFKQHGNYKIYDYNLAKENGDIPQDYYKWWGFEDKVLFELAKKELVELSSSDKPFNFTMLTVDMHHNAGFLCDLCDNKYSDKTANVVSCIDKQIYNFVNWCKQQEFYDDTVIVITGDHTRMDKCLVDGATRRPIYNCFINTGLTENLNTKNRLATILDIFPTVLYSLGFEWSGDRLGLGTNLFARTKTLAETLGLEYLNTELGKSSKYYLKNFA